MSQRIRPILYLGGAVIGAFAAIKLLDLLMIWSVYSAVFQQIRAIAGFDDLLTGAISIWVTIATLALIPMAVSVIFWKKNPKKLLIVAGAVSGWMVVLYFLGQPKPGQYFNPITGQAQYRYYQAADGNIELFPLGYRYHPRYGVQLQPITSSTVKSMDEIRERMRKQEEAERQKKVEGQRALEQQKRMEGQRAEEKSRDDQKAKQIEDLKAELAKQKEELEQKNTAWGMQQAVQSAIMTDLQKRNDSLKNDVNSLQSKHDPEQADVYPITVDPVIPFEERIRLGNYSVISPEINQQNFKLVHSGSKNIILYDVKYPQTTEQIIERMIKNHDQPADLDEALEIGRKYPGLQRIYTIFFLGSDCSCSQRKSATPLVYRDWRDDPYNWRCVPTLQWTNSSSGSRWLRVMKSFPVTWDAFPSYRFAAIQGAR